MLEGNSQAAQTSPSREWKVLIIDTDENYLLTLEKILEDCNFKVTKCYKAEQSLTILRESKSMFDLIIIDVDMSGIDGFELVRLIRREMHIPVILMSTNSDGDVMKKGFESGACDFFEKPIKVEDLWKHMFRMDASKKSMMEQDRTFGDLENQGDISNMQDVVGDGVVKIKTQDGNRCCSLKRNDPVNVIDAPSKKKQRVIWTSELHEKFLAAVNKFGITNAVPKKILEIMNVPGLTRENVASHLQKYRQFHKKQEETSQQRSKISPAAQIYAQDGLFQGATFNHRLPPPVSPAIPLMSLNKLIMRPESEASKFDVGCHQIASWKDLGNEEKGFEGLTCHVKYGNNLTASEYEIANHRMMMDRISTSKHVNSLYNHHHHQAPMETFSPCGPSDGYHKPLGMQMVQHYNNSELPNVMGSLYEQFELNGGANKLLPDTILFDGHSDDSIAPLMLKMQHNHDHLDRQVFPEMVVQDNSTLNHATASTIDSLNMDSEFHHHQIEPTMWNSNTTYNDPTLIVKQFERGGMLMEQLDQGNAEPAEFGLASKSANEIFW